MPLSTKSASRSARREASLAAGLVLCTPERLLNRSNPLPPTGECVCEPLEVVVERLFNGLDFGENIAKAAQKALPVRGNYLPVLRELFRIGTDKAFGVVGEGDWQIRGSGT